MSCRACDCSRGAGVGLSRTIEYSDVAARRNSRNDINNYSIFVLSRLLTRSKGVIWKLFMDFILEAFFQTRKRTISMAPSVLQRLRGGREKCYRSCLCHPHRLPSPARHREDQYYCLIHHRKIHRQCGAALIRSFVSDSARWHLSPSRDICVTMPVPMPVCRLV